MRDFADYMLYELRRSRHTVEAYCRDIGQFRDWVCTDGAEFRVADVTTADLRAWLGSLARHDSPLTLRRKAQSLRAYFRWLLARGEVSHNPAADLVLAKAPSRLPEFVKEREIEEIVGNYNASDFKECRTHIVMLMLYSTGLRQEELRTLTDADIDFSLREMKVTGKRNKQRIIPLPQPLLSEIAAWQQMRDAHYPSLPDPKPMIAGASGAVSKRTLYGIVHNALSASSALRKSPHVLRHTFATTMLNDGAALDSVKEFLGHSSLSTTQIYTHLSFNELKKSYSTAHPRARSRGN